MKTKTIIIIIAMACIAPTIKSETAITLAECRRMAINNNEDIAQADNKYRQAELDKDIAFASYFPSISGSLTALYAKDLDMMGTTLQMRGMYMAGLTLMQPLYAGGKIMAANKMAKIGVESLSESRRMTVAEVITQADNAYWSYIAVGEKVKLLEAYSTQLDELARQIKISVEAEMATNNDALRVEAKQSQIQYQLQKANNGKELCRMALCNIMGLPLDSIIIPADTNILVSPPVAMAATIEDRPEYKLLKNQVELQEQQVKSARSEILPVLGLSAIYSYYGNIKLAGTSQGYSYTQEFKDDFPLAVASLSIPILNWGKGIKGIKKAKLELDNKRLELSKNERLMNIELKQAEQNISDGYNMIKSSTIAVAQASENLRNMQLNYEVGMCTLTDLLDAQAQWQEARSCQIEAETQYKIYETEYLRVTGRLSNE